jgi:GT2 family glycosyltransferase
MQVPPIRLSIVIVSYNVRAHLAQALLSVQAALRNIAHEILVVDNASADGSAHMVHTRFAHVGLIQNQTNVGFARANNQALAQCSGQYVLILNPDTVVAEDCLAHLLQCLEADPSIGAVGPRILNGEGGFAPESKRALPTPRVAFYKLFGLGRLFPQSAKLNRYHLKNLADDVSQPVPVLSGSCMLVRRSLMAQLGGFDERFFMYGEDVDLCYRITQAGFQNYYCAQARILHYKGRSTPRGLRNALTFYHAMWLFARKHLRRSWHLPVALAIVLRTALELLLRSARKLGLPALEALQAAAIVAATKTAWQTQVAYAGGGSYPQTFFTVAWPLYTAAFILLLALAGAYQKPYRLRAVVAGCTGAFVALATISYLLPHINFSRAIVGLSAAGMLVVGIANRAVINYRTTGRWTFAAPQPRTLLVGSGAEALRLLQLHKAVGYIAPTPDAALHPYLWLGTPDRLAEIAATLQATNVLVCADAASANQLMDWLATLGARTRCAIVPTGSNIAIGPESLQPLASPADRQWVAQKRLVDSALGGALLALFPLTFWAYRKPLQALRGLMSVQAGRRHLVGYAQPAADTLPYLRPGLLALPAPNAADANARYASLRNAWHDVTLVLRQLPRLGTQP